MTLCERTRVTALCACLLLFLSRVIGQVEVVLLQPDWLPPMHAWYSGLIPYPALLPVQIVLLMIMALVAYDHARGYGMFWPRKRSTRAALAGFAGFYAVAMAARLILTLSVKNGGLLESGMIPVAFHWVLACFLALLSAAPAESANHIPRAS
jgi:hypothetical protein